MISEILRQNNANNLCKEIYYQKMDDLIEDINQFLKNEGYGEKNDAKINNKKYNSNNQLSERLDYDCPDGPYPNL